MAAVRRRLLAAAAACATMLTTLAQDVEHVDCLDPPCADDAGSCPMAYIEDMLEALDEICCRDHIVTQWEVENDLVPMDKGPPRRPARVNSVSEPCTYGVPHYCTYECASAMTEYNRLCGRVDILDVLGGFDGHGLDGRLAEQCRTVMQLHATRPPEPLPPCGEPPLNIACHSCDLADQWHNLLALATNCDPGVSSAMTIDPDAVSQLGDAFCSSRCYQALEPWYSACGTISDGTTDTSIQGLAHGNSEQTYKTMLHTTMTPFLPLMQHCADALPPPAPPTDVSSGCDLATIAATCAGQVPASNIQFCFSPCATMCQRSMKVCRHAVDNQGNNPVAEAVHVCGSLWNGGH